MVSQKNIKAWLPFSVAVLVGLTVLGMAVHASTTNTDKRSRESCSSAAHKQFHTDAKKATKEWWDEAEPRDEKGHQKLLKELKKQHATFHKAMRGKKSCPSVSLPVSRSVSSIALPSSRSGSALPTAGSLSKSAAPSPSPAVPSVNIPSPSGNGSPSPDIPSPTISSSPSSTVSSSSGALRSSTSASSSVDTASISDSPPIIASITPYVPLPLNEHLISSVTLQWNAVANPTSYLTYYKAWRKLGNGDWLYWANTQQTTFPDLNLGRGTYYYYVNACYTTTGSPLVLVTDHCSSDSNIMTVTLAGGGNTSDTTPPSTPTGLMASIVNSDSPYISWTVSTDNVGVAGYNIYRNGTYLKSVCCTPAIDDSVSRSTTASYTVVAYDAAGNISAQSASVSVTTQ